MLPFILHPLPDLREIIDLLAQRVPDEIDATLHVSDVGVLLPENTNKQAIEFTMRLFDESELEEFQKRDTYLVADVADYLEVEIQFCLGEKLLGVLEFEQLEKWPPSLMTLERALYLLTVLPESISNEAHEKQKKWAEGIVVAAGKSNGDGRLRFMQNAYYAVTNSYWFRSKGAEYLSDIRYVLARCWDGIGEFKT